MVLSYLLLLFTLFIFCGMYLMCMKRMYVLIPQDNATPIEFMFITHADALAKKQEIVFLEVDKEQMDFFRLYKKAQKTPTLSR